MDKEAVFKKLRFGIADNSLIAKAKKLLTAFQAFTMEAQSEPSDEVLENMTFFNHYHVY
jgi:hypothetical protein